MTRSTDICERLPRIAIVGLFQGGKSLLLNAALGGSVVPVGKFGLRTTPCRIRCRYGEINRAVVYYQCDAPRAFNIQSFHAFAETPDNVQHLAAVDFFYSHSLLQKIELLDTPGIDFSERDDNTALDAAREADGVILVVQQSLPSASSAFSKLAACLHDKPWGLVLNCGRAGPHLEHPNSPASMEVEAHCVRQLTEAGLHNPLFAQRMSARTLPYYASEQSEAAKSVSMSEENLEDLKADEDSVRTWRDNLLLLGEHWIEEQLGHVRNRVITSLHKQEWIDPTFRFEAVGKTFDCRVGYDGNQYKVTGKFLLETIKGGRDRLLLHSFKCREEWVVEWLESQRRWHTWEI